MDNLCSPSKTDPGPTSLAQPHLRYTKFIQGEASSTLPKAGRDGANKTPTFTQPRKTALVERTRAPTKPLGPGQNSNQHTISHLPFLGSRKTQEPKQRKRKQGLPQKEFVEPNWTPGDTTLKPCSTVVFWRWTNNCSLDQIRPSAGRRLHKQFAHNKALFGRGCCALFVSCSSLTLTRLLNPKTNGIVCPCSQCPEKIVNRTHYIATL